MNIIYLANGSVAFIIVDFDFKVSTGSFLGFLQPADNIFVGFLALYNRQGFATNLGIQWDILYIS
jgi:hypothetical protein